MSRLWEKLAVSSPINKTAGVVAARSKGIAPAGPKPGATQHWSEPPPTIPVPPQADLDLGHRCGRFTVVGYIGKLNPKWDKGRWLVRCSCGDYEARTAKALRNPLNGEDACINCRHTAHLKRSFTSNTHRDDGSRGRQSS